MGGIETMLVNIAGHQARCGHAVHVVVVNDLEDPALVARLAPEVGLHRIGRPVGSRSPMAIVRTQRLISSLRPDVTHLHNPGLHMLAPLEVLRGRAVMTLHRLWDQGLPAWPLRRMRRVFAISQGVAAALRKGAGIEAPVVYNGIETQAFATRGDRGPGVPLQVVQVGRLIAEKGHDVLLEAAARLPQGAVELTFIGDGPQAPALAAMAARLGVRLTMKGTMPQEWMKGHLRDYDVLVQPSRSEGFGLTIAEAMASRLPVVASRLEGPLEVLGGGRYGRVCEVGDAVSLAGCLEQCISDPASPALLDEARAYAAEHFDVERTARQYVDQYRLALKLL